MHVASLRGSTKAYTMLEMMIIVVVIGALAAMAVPGFMTMMPRLRLRADARESIAYLRQARSRAVAENRQYGIYFDLAQSRLVLFKDLHQPVLAAYDEGLDSVVTVSRALSNGIAYDMCSFANNCVVFFPSGSASQSGMVRVTHTASGRNYTISVAASTGRITLQ